MSAGGAHFAKQLGRSVGWLIMPAESGQPHRRLWGSSSAVRVVKWACGERGQCPPVRGSVPQPYELFAERVPGEGLD